MSGFIPWLERASGTDTKVRAVLRRSLSSEPGTHVPAFPYVEPFVAKESSHWSRTAHYLVAGLWAAAASDTRGSRKPLAEICAQHALVTKTDGAERRFLGVLDADSEQLAHRLRQLVMLLKDQPIDFEALLRDLLFWNDDRRRVQTRWARAFYQTLNKTQTSTTAETAE